MYNTAPTSDSRAVDCSFSCYCYIQILNFTRASRLLPSQDLPWKTTGVRGQKSTEYSDGVFKISTAVNSK